MTSELKVYFYACYDEADKQAYSGLTIGLCAASVREDVRKNFRHPKYISVHRVPELAVAVDGDGREYIIPQGWQSRRDSERFEGMGPSKIASDDQSGCLHSAGRPEGGTCELQRKAPQGTRGR